MPSSPTNTTNSTTVSAQSAHAKAPMPIRRGAGSRSTSTIGDYCPGRDGTVTAPDGGCDSGDIRYGGGHEGSTSPSAGMCNGPRDAGPLVVGPPERQIE